MAASGPPAAPERHPLLREESKMAIAQPYTPARPGALPVRRIGADDLRLSLRQGLEDFREKRGDLLVAGLLYPLIGIFTAVAMLGGNVLHLFFPVAAGIALMGPVAAVGFYELARRREEGGEAGWNHFFDVRKRPAWGDIVAVSALLLLIFFLWIAAAGALYVALWGNEAPHSVGAFVEWLFTTSEGWALIIVGNLVGAAFAVLVLAISAISLPMLVDRSVSASAAVATSVAAFRENRAVMLRWGIMVAALLVVGSIPFFIGLAFVLPWLGYATWHLYTRTVERDAPR